MFLFILESIGTSELILIAIVALIVFGPRKLPQMAKTIAKTMAEFRSATNEFKSTWEKEVAFDSEIKQELNQFQKEIKESTVLEDQFQIAQPATGKISTSPTVNQLAPPPMVREVSPEEFTKTIGNKEVTHNTGSVELVADEKKATDKRDWL